MSIQSMTGFARLERNFNKIKLYVEIRSINNRYFDIKLSQPQVYNAFSHEVNKMLSQEFSRGTFDVIIKRDVLSEDYLKLSYNKPQAAKIKNILSQMKNDLNLSNDITISNMLSFNVVSFDNFYSEDDMRFEWNALKEIITDGIQALKTMREREGKTLWEDLKKKCAIVTKLSGEIEARYDLSIKAYTDRVQERLNKTLSETSKKSSIDINDPRFHMEIAYIAEKCDISEELTRLKSHVSEFEKLGELKDSVGRKMDFLLQEMNREVNTISSKNINKDFSLLIVELKTEIEKIRQQVQNID